MLTIIPCLEQNNEPIGKIYVYLELIFKLVLAKYSLFLRSHWELQKENIKYSLSLTDVIKNEVNLHVKTRHDVYVTAEKKIIKCCGDEFVPGDFGV